MNTSLHCVSLAAFCFHPLSDLAEPGAHRPLVPSKSDMLQPPGEMHLSRQSCAGGKGIPTSQKLVPSLETPAWGVLDVTTTERKALSEAARELEKQGHRGAGAAGPAANPPCLAQQHPHPSALQLFSPFCTLASPFLAAQNRQREGKRLAGRFPQATENHGAQSWAELGDDRTCFGDNPRAMWCDHAGLGVGVSF